MTFNWQQPDWPEFRYDVAAVQDDLLALASEAGEVGGVLRSLPTANGPSGTRSIPYGSAFNCTQDRPPT